MSTTVSLGRPPTYRPAGPGRSLPRASGAWAGGARDGLERGYAHGPAKRREAADPRTHGLFHVENFRMVLSDETPRCQVNAPSVGLE
jgi:hypothetical protein